MKPGNLSNQVPIPTDESLKKLERIALVACGTSWHAALLARYWLEKWVGIPVEVDIATEFRYRRLLLNRRSRPRATVRLPARALA